MICRNVIRNRSCRMLLVRMIGLRKELLKSSNWILGIQWLFFIFTNIVVIPITVGAVFELPPEKTVMLLQLSFIVTGIACIAQGLLGHRRAIVEGQSGLWWGVLLSVAYMAAAHGIPLDALGWSLAVGVIISGFLSVVIGLTGMGWIVAKLFNANVMGVFMFLLGLQLVSNFLKGMLGIPFGSQSDSAQFDLSVTMLSVVIVFLVMLLNIRAPFEVKKYSLL